MRKPFSLTYVTYEVDDPMGKIMAIVTLAPIYTVVALVALILSRRDLHTCLFLAWQLANEALNIVLKRMLRQTRPQGAEKTDYGMPSDHAQFMFFTATYFALLLLLRCRANSLAWRCLLSASGLAGAALVAYSRVHLAYHTVQQVAVGAGVGIAVAVAAFAANTTAILPALRPLTGHWLARWLLVRDVGHVDDVLRLEYEATAVQRWRKAQ